MEVYAGKGKVLSKYCIEDVDKAIEEFRHRIAQTYAVLEECEISSVQYGTSDDGYLSEIVAVDCFAHSHYIDKIFYRYNGQISL